jgi:hypothetical protein
MSDAPIDAGTRLGAAVIKGHGACGRDPIPCRPRAARQSARDVDYPATPISTPSSSSAATSASAYAGCSPNSHRQPNPAVSPQHGSERRPHAMAAVRSDWQPLRMVRMWIPSLDDRELRERLRRRMHLVRMRASAQNPNLWALDPVGSARLAQALAPTRRDGTAGLARRARRLVRIDPRSAGRDRPARRSRRSV